VIDPKNMDEFLYWWEHLPLSLDPVAFNFGSIEIGWYSLMYLVGFLVVYVLLVYRIRFDSIQELSSSSTEDSFVPLNSLIVDFLFYAFIGLLIGARLGYVLFYNPGHYWENPLAIISPFNRAGELVGIYGMSYHGGVIGIFIASYFFLRKHRVHPVKSAEGGAASPQFDGVNFWAWSDFIVPAVPAGYFFGRIGNFLNGELYGRIAVSRWGMYFPDNPYITRHPSQLYEAVLEGLLLFIILWLLRNKKLLQGKFLGLYFIGYSIARFIAEFWREPDEQIGFVFWFFTLGQLFSVAMLAAGLILLFNFNKKSYNIIDEKNTKRTNDRQHKTKKY